MKMLSSLLLWSFVAGLLSQSLVVPVMSSDTVNDQKTYYSHDPHHGHHHTPTPSTPTPSTPTPSTPTPTPSTPTPTPYTPTPSHGSSGGSHGGSTPKACPTPSRPSKSPPSGHHGGGGYYPSPTPSAPSGGSTPSTPSTPTPSTPTPSIPTPTTPSTPPYLPDPNSPPFDCNYWRNHPQLIWGILGWWGTLGHAFDVPSVPGMSASISLKDALSNTRTDGYGELCRQATASFLNSMVDHTFTFSTKQVRDSFVAALASDKSAAAQASIFKRANEANN